MTCGQGDKLVASCVKKWSRGDCQCGNVLTLNGFERFVDCRITADSKFLNLQAKGARCLAQIAQLGLVGWVRRQYFTFSLAACDVL